MEPQKNAAEEARYEALAMALKSPDRHDHDEPFEEALDLVGANSLEVYESKLLLAVLDKISEGPIEGGGIALKFTREVKDKMENFRPDYGNFEHIQEVLDRIVAFPNANREARKVALRALFSVPRLYLTKGAVSQVGAILDSGITPREDSFEEEAVKLAAQAATDVISHKTDDGSNIQNLYKIVTKALIDGNLDEGLSRRFVRRMKEAKLTLKDKFPVADLEILKSISSSTAVAPDISEMARSAILAK